MPRINLTNEEARHIEQRRENERRFAHGYNQCLDDLGNYLAEIEAQGGEGAVMESISVKVIDAFINNSRRTIR